jgi:GNAT superfamily N-acetyltransferase
VKPSFVLRKVDARNKLLAEAISAMDEECFGPEEGRFIPKADYHWWIAFQGKEEAGYAGLAPSSQWLNCGYLCRAGVLEKFRGQGLQKRLIKVRVNYAKKLGWEAVMTDTRCNPPSSNNLIDCGFRMYTPASPWGWHDAVYWRKKLC